MDRKEHKDYIERDAALNIAFEWCPDDDGSVGKTGDLRDMLDEIEAIPAADVRPVVRGRWIHTTQPMGWRDEECAECSVCGEDFVLDEWAMDDFTNLMHFCPNCGADMREEV